MLSLEKFRILCEQAVANRDNLTDEQALAIPELYADWAVGKYYAEKDRFVYNGELYRPKQPHTSQADWTPDIATSLYAKVERAGEGTHDNPIHYTGNMRLYKDLYYEQDGILYICVRDTGTEVFHPLSELVGLYVNEVN